MTTTGYGDFTSEPTAIDRIVTLFLLLFGVTIWVGVVQVIVNEHKDTKLRETPRQTVLSSLFTFASVAAVGAVGIKLFEGWCWDEAVYWAVVSCTSLGLGDFTPRTLVGRLFTAFYLLFGTTVCTRAVVDIARIPARRKLRRRRARILREVRRHVDTDLNASVSSIHSNSIPPMRGLNRWLPSPRTAGGLDTVLLEESGGAASPRSRRTAEGAERAVKAAAELRGAEGDEQLRELATNGVRSDFVIFAFVTMGLVTQEDVDEIMDAFDSAAEFQVVEESPGL